MDRDETSPEGWGLTLIFVAIHFVTQILAKCLIKAFCSTMDTPVGYYLQASSTWIARGMSQLSPMLLCTSHILIHLIGVGTMKAPVAGTFLCSREFL